MPKKTRENAIKSSKIAIQLPPIQAPLVGWYHGAKRQLPFRSDPTPYHVWVSEIMLQQTQVATVLPYYRRFIAALPDVAALAACDEEALHKLWEGLGYYSRVRNMQRAASAIMQNHGGVIPASYEALLALPGIGPYTAGAIASIAFGLPYAAVDGNVLRVAARLLACHGDIAATPVKRALGAAVQHSVPAACPGDYNQALMELGALVCLPASPQCGACPLQSLCAAYAKGIQQQLPVKAPARAKTQQHFCVLLVHSAGRVLIHRRPATGLLAGLWEPLLFEGPCTRKDAQQKLDALIPGARILAPLPKTRHIFTHRVWQLAGWQCTAPPQATAPGPDYRFATPQALSGTYTLPGAFAAYLPFMHAPPVAADSI